MVNLPTPTPQPPGITASISHITLAEDPRDTTLSFPQLTLPINPQKIHLSRQAKIQGVQTMIPTDFANAVMATGKLVIKLNEIWLLGQPFVAETLNTLFALVSPWPAGQRSTFSPAESARSPGATMVPLPLSTALPGVDPLDGQEPSLPIAAITPGDGQGGSPTQQPGSGSSGGKGVPYCLPMVKLTWGNGLTYSVNVTNVDTDVTKMSMGGEPIEAKVDLTVTAFPYVPEGTNPTSGGPAGRRRHTVIAGDNIVRIAATQYGDPKAWRAVAAANGLDDALRLPAGRTLFLPGRADVASLTAARRRPGVPAS